jgi:hypothetical protein
VQKRKIRKTAAPEPMAAPPEVTATEARAPADAAGPEPGIVKDDTVKEDHDDPAPAENSDAGVPVVDVAEGEGEATAAVAIVPQTLAAPVLAANADPAVDEVEIEVWWPKDTGPFRRRMPDKRPHHRPAAAAKKDGTGGDKPDGALRGKEKREPRKPQRKSERPPDPLSPFAVLGSLKARFDKS